MCFSRVFRGSARAAIGFLLLAAIVLGVHSELARAQTATATYTVTFQGNWNLDSTPGGVVGSAHFTTLIGAVHNSGVTFWAPGGTATAGVELVAELGSTGTFESEINNAPSGTVRSRVKHGGTGATGTSTFDVTFSRTHPLLTLLSMIGPSPDWFVGVSRLSLLSGSNWRSSYTVNLFPYDAGTENGEEFSLSNSATNPQGVITSLRNQGKFTDVRMARLSFTLKTPQPQPPQPPPPEEEVCAVSEVTNARSLSKFVECAAENIEASDTFEKTLSLLEKFRDDEGDWNDGSTYLVLLTKEGGVYFHANDREAEDLDWSGVLSCEGGGSVLERQGGCFIEYDGERSGYAHPFSASHVPLARAGDEFVLVGGFDETPQEVVPFPIEGEIAAPSVQAGDVETLGALMEFVEDAERALRSALEDSGINFAQLRGALRQKPWRDGDVYVYIMDETGRVIFDGADRSKEQELTGESGRQYVVNSIEEGAEEVVHTEGDFSIYAIKVVVDSRVYVVGSGYRVAVEPEPGGSGDGGGGCAIGGSGGVAFSSLLMVSLLFSAALWRSRPNGKQKQFPGINE